MSHRRPVGAASSTKSTTSSISQKRERQTRIEFGTPNGAAATAASPAISSDASDPKRRKLTGSTPADSNNAMEVDNGSSVPAPIVATSSTGSSVVGGARVGGRRAHSPVPKKKMVIKPFKVKPQLAASFEEDMARKLTEAVDAVYAKQAITMSQEELYRAVEALCSHHKAPQLYEKLVAQCERHVARIVEALAAERQRCVNDAVAFLPHVQTTWNAHCDEMMIIRGIFLYLDRTYVIQLSAAAASHAHNNNNSMDDSTHAPSAAPKSLWEMGLGLFGHQLRAHADVEQSIITGLLTMIERDRNGEAVSYSLLKTLLRMLTALKFYATAFQPIFLETTAAFYHAESARSLLAPSPTEYIHYIEQRLRQEEERASTYLDDMTRAPLIQLMQRELIQTHATHMLDAGFRQLLDTKRIVELRTMYKLFERVAALDQMKESFGAYVKATASAIVQSGSTEPEDKSAAAPASASVVPAAAPAAAAASTPATMIMDLLRLKATLDEILDFSFASNPDFQYALKVAFESALNLVENKPAELIAKFIDRVLRTGGKGMKITAAPTTSSDETSSLAPTASASTSLISNDEVESLLDAVMFLFRYIHGKDVFQAFYKKDLAKRLLLSKSASVDAEKSMLNKIKQECGASFTTKLEGMFKDIELSKEMQIAYEQHRAQQLQQQAAVAASAGAAPPMELSVRVLTTGSWPAYTPVECTLPSEVARAHEDFRLFYLNKHNGRKLIWHHSLATADLRAHFAKGRKELAVSGMQAVVLLLFNDHINLTMEEIGKYSGITDAMELKRTLASLTFTEDVKILLKKPANKKLTPTDVFRVNEDFAYKLFRIKINSVQLKETKEEQKATQTKVFEDRQYALDAAIVRIMKARKTLSHQLLLLEVVSQIKFPSTPADIKRRIASLIEREYMERDKNDSAVYNYMA